MPSLVKSVPDNSELKHDLTILKRKSLNYIRSNIRTWASNVLGESGRKITCVLDILILKIVSFLVVDVG